MTEVRFLDRALPFGGCSLTFSSRSFTVLRRSLTVLCLSLTVLRLSLTVLRLSLAVLRLSLTVLRLSLTVLRLLGKLPVMVATGEEQLPVDYLNQSMSIAPGRTGAYFTGTPRAPASLLSFC